MNNIKKLVACSLVLIMIFAQCAQCAQVGAMGFEEIVEDCDSCHGKDGNSTQSHIPTIAGISEYYFLETMSSFKKEERLGSKQSREGQPDTNMNECAQMVGIEMTKQLATYYAKKTFIRLPQAFDEVKAKAGKKHFRKYCEKCHEDSGRSVDDDAGILAGQQTQYLKDTMAQIISGEREIGKKMKSTC